MNADAIHLSNAYLALMRLSPNGSCRNNLQGAMASIRDVLADVTDREAEDMQNDFEIVVRLTK